jgi:hypothetical protein
MNQVNDITFSEIVLKLLLSTQHPTNALVRAIYEHKFQL